MRLARYIVFTLFELSITPVLFIAAAVCRYRTKPVDVGLGPEPLINNVHHKKALVLKGFSVETFVSHVYYVTQAFDVRGDKYLSAAFLNHLKPVRILRRYLIDITLFLRVIRTYKCIYIYINGGAIGIGTTFWWRIEPMLYRLAGTRVVVMPYGGDVQELSRSPNLPFKHTMAVQYPLHRFRRREIGKKIDLWTKHADHLISGCEWVDYMYYWDTLMMGHFSIDTDAWKPAVDDVPPHSDRPLKILHAPNHRALKGSAHFIKAVDALVSEGYDIELELVENVSNETVKEKIRQADIVADQLVIGWYAMFAIEAMAMQKPVLCYLRDDLLQLYAHTGLVDPDTIPVINCNPTNVKENIKKLYRMRSALHEIGLRSREYVNKHHSIDTIGDTFAAINRSLHL